MQFTLAHKGYDNHYCHIKLQTRNEAGVWMTSCSEEIGREFGRFWKRFSWVPTMVLRSWVRPWCWEVGSVHGVEKLGSDHEVEKLGSTMELKVDIRPWRQTVEFSAVAAAVKFFSEDELRSKTPRDVPNVGGVVSIVWFRKTFKNCLSPRVKEPISEVNKPAVPEQESRLCICILWFAFVNVFVEPPNETRTHSCRFASLSC